jgi:predicted permease
MRLEHLIYKLPLRLRSLFRRPQLERELNEELSYHVDQKTKQYIAEGRTADAARTAALRSMGGLELRKEECRDMRRVTWIQDLAQDIRYGFRILRKNPGFTAAAVITLGLGIGVNAAIFSIVNAVLFKSLPVREPKELVDVYTTEHGEFFEYAPMAYPDYEDFRDQNRTLAGLIGFAPTQVAMQDKNETELIPTEEVTGDYFETLGVQMLLGRGFDPARNKAIGGDPVAVLSYGTWQRKFGSDPHVVGKTILLNGNVITIVGVAYRNFHGLMCGISPGLWVPISMDHVLHLGNPVHDRGSQWLFVMGRLNSGVSIHQAQADLKAIASGLGQQYPDTNKNRSAALLPASKVKIIPEVDTALYTTSGVLLGFVGLILFIACANIAGMLLARASVRRREIALRTALGANRLRLIRQLLTESLLLSLLGGTLALGMTAAFNVVVSRGLENIHMGIPVGFGLTLSVDFRVLGFTLLIVTAATFLFGLFPALNASSGSLPSALKEESGTLAGSQRKHRILNALVVGQVTVSLLLLICAGLSLRSMRNASRVDPGFDSRNVASASFLPSLAGYDSKQAYAYYQQLTDRVRALPGVQSVSFADRLPLTFVIQLTSCAPEGKTTVPKKQWQKVDRSAVGPSYFETMRIPILRGRPFMERQGSASPLVVIVNEALATLFWPGQDPIGKRLWFTKDDKPYEVVAVARDGKYRTLGEGHRPFAYWNIQQTSSIDEFVLARTGEDPRVLLASIRQISREIDPKVPATNLETLEEQTSVALLLPRAGGFLFGLFGLLGLTLASVGLYGVIAYSVSQRTHEIGIRMALGASPREISNLIMGRGLGLVLIGTVLGLAGAFALTRILSIMLYGVSATDPLTFAGVALFLATVAMGACFVPTRRAMRVDPMLALRYE